MKTLDDILNEPFTDGWQKTIEKKKAAILDLVKKAVPEKREIDRDSLNSQDDAIGFNDCRKQMLKRLEEL